jgi:hypothetical protein
MRPLYLPLATLLAVSISLPAWAQSRTTATPDTVVARLMSFDRNADGRIVADELPDRMQSLLARGDTSNDGALDRAEVSRLAMAPVPHPAAQNGLEPTRWGTGAGFTFDTSQHIEGALDDLRLAADTKERALDMTQQFMASASAKALDDLLATMGELLNGEQLDDFRTAVEGRKVSVPAIRRDGVTFFGATAEETAGHERVMVDVRVASLDLERHILLTDEQRDDLRAALARRPVVQLTGIVSALSPRTFVRPAADSNGTFVEIQDLLLGR